jgi:uncharacterized protein YutE (UPF0331/DUF86 family)
MVKRDLTARKVARALAWLDDAERKLGLPRSEFLADPGARDLAAFYVFLATQECIDLASHWIADEGLPPADDHGGSFDVLADRGRIDRALAGGMRAATGLRNRIAHGYATLDHERLYDESRAGLGTLRRFLDAVARAAGL